MRQRLISAAVLVTVVVIVFLLGQPWLTLFIAALAAAAAWETAQLVRMAGLNADRWLAVAFAIVGVLSMWWALDRGLNGTGAVIAMAFVAIVVVVTASLALRKVPRDGFLTWVGGVVAALYPGMLAFVAGIALIPRPLPPSVVADHLDAGRAWLLVLILTVWSLDSFAYIAGKYHGRGRFMNHISPNKTWSGAIGGSIAAVVVCTALTVLVGESPLLGLVLGVLLAVAAQAGDLTESMLKRAAGAKDSGTLIPGHGGFLDRLDSFLFAGPTMFFVLALLQAWPLTSIDRLIP